MKTLTTSIILSVMFLSAGAFAGNRDGAQPSSQATASQEQIENVTVVTKNGVWPLPGQISVEPCSHRRCIDI